MQRLSRDEGAVGPCSRFPRLFGYQLGLEHNPPAEKKRKGGNWPIRISTTPFTTIGAHAAAHAAAHVAAHPLWRSLWCRDEW